MNMYLFKLLDIYNTFEGISVKKLDLKCFEFIKTNNLPLILINKRIKNKYIIQTYGFRFL